DGPKNGNHPGDGVAHGVAFAQDAAVLIDVITGYAHDARVDRDHGIRLDDHAVELQFHPALADEVAGIPVILKAAHEVAVVRQRGAAVPLREAEAAQDRIADGGGFGGEFG